MARQPDVKYVRFYTDGSAARKVEVAGPIRKNALPPKTRKKKKIVLYVDPLAILGIFTAIIMLTIMFSSMAMLQNAKAETAAMEQYVTQLREENATLQNEYEDGYDIREVERTALALGMIPMEQAQHVTLEKDPAPVVQLEERQTDTWDWIYTLLTGLFA